MAIGGMRLEGTDSPGLGFVSGNGDQRVVGAYPVAVDGLRLTVESPPSPKHAADRLLWWHLPPHL